MSVKFPKDKYLSAFIYMNPYGNFSESKDTEWIYGSIDFMTQITGLDAHYVKSGLKYGVNQLYRGFVGSIKNITSTFNEISMEWENQSIIWRLNEIQFHKEKFDKLLQYDNSGKYYKSLGEPFNKYFYIGIEISVDPKIYTENRFDVHTWTDPYLYIDYIRVYEWNEEQMDQSDVFPVIEILVGFLIVVIIIGSVIIVLCCVLIRNKQKSLDARRNSIEMKQKTDSIINQYEDVGLNQDYNYSEGGYNYICENYDHIENNYERVNDDANNYNVASGHYLQMLAPSVGSFVQQQPK